MTPQLLVAEQQWQCHNDLATTQTRSTASRAPGLLRKGQQLQQCDRLSRVHSTGREREIKGEIEANGTKCTRTVESVMALLRLALCLTELGRRSSSECHD